MSASAQHDDTSKIDEAARRRFEAAWRAGKPEPIDKFLPNEDASHYRATLEELVHIEMELAWKGQANAFPFPVEEYLSRYPNLQEPAIVRRLLKQEYQCRKRAGANPELTEYRARFPHLPFGDDEFEPTCVAPTKPAETLPAIPGYEILGVLGKGGMGVVYKAKQISLGRIVALKQIVAGAAASSEDLARFKNEASTVARLQHPNIVQIYEVGEFSGRPFLVLEYVDGGSLAKRLGGTPFQERQAAELTATLARAIDAVHQKGILHRDLKPHNVLLQVADGKPMPDGQSGSLNLGSTIPKITDFGLAKQLERRTETDGASLTETGVVVGTPSYMAPEQAAGKTKEIGPAADIYALGAILYEMTTGRPPFRGATAIETIGQVLSEDAISPRRLRKELPRDLETICMKCLQKEPRRRYASALDLADDLDRFLAGESIRARPVSSLERAWRWCRRKPMQAALSAALGVALVGAIVGFFFWRQALNERENQEREYTLTKRQEALRRRESMRAAAENQQRLALSELHAGQFPSALKFMREAMQNVRDEPELKTLQKSLEESHDRLKRLVDFYAISDRAERRAFLEDDESALRLCENGLRTLGVFEHPQEWWLHLPADELSIVQREKLTRDANHQLTLLAGLWIKEAIVGAAPKPGHSPTKKALETLGLVEGYHKARKLEPPLAGQFLELFARHGLAGARKTKPLADKEPVTASDCYLVGISMFWTGHMPDNALSRVTTPMLQQMGLDPSKAKGVAERYLRRAAAEEPGHYWSHFWLGWILLADKEYKAAELAFNNCITVRPDYGLGYAERASSLIYQLDAATDERTRTDLVRRCKADVAKALALDPHDFHAQIMRLAVAKRLNDRDELRDAVVCVLDLVPPPALASAAQRVEHTHLLRFFEKEFEQAAADNPTDADLRAYLARIRHGLQKESIALRDAEKALDLARDDPRFELGRRLALIVRGFAFLNQKDLPKAQTDFETLLQKQPANYRAAHGLAWTHEIAQEWDRAHKGYDALLQLAATDWQRLNAFLGLTRILQAMGKVQESQAMLERATELHPNAALLLKTARRQ